MILHIVVVDIIHICLCILYGAMDLISHPQIRSAILKQNHRVHDLINHPQIRSVILKTKPSFPPPQLTIRSTGRSWPPEASTASMACCVGPRSTTWMLSSSLCKERCGLSTCATQIPNPTTTATYAHGEAAHDNHVPVLHQHRFGAQMRRRSPSTTAILPHLAKLQGFYREGKAEKKSGQSTSSPSPIPHPPHATHPCQTNTDCP